MVVFFVVRVKSNEHTSHKVTILFNFLLDIVYKLSKFMRYTLEVPK